jgi:mannose-6-phosphate isomerase-like protein (cupin superfamily)
MEEKRTGFITPIAEARISTGPKEGHPRNQGIQFMKEPGKYVSLGLNKIQPGGGIEEHYHEYNAEMPIYDHVYWVVSGRIRANVGDTVRIIRADSLIYCPSSVRHSITNVGKGLAKVLVISGFGQGDKMGCPVYSKTPSGDLKAHPWRLASEMKPPKTAETRTGYIMTINEAQRGGGAEGHPGNQGYSYLRPTTAAVKVGKEPSMHISLGLNKIQPGGGIEEHYHEYDAEMPIFDHIYYVISGRIRATIGDKERIVGADSLIYCPSNVRHSITNVGEGPAKLIRLSGSGEGARMGGPVYSKMPSGNLGVMPWKVATS